jgi:hypothetical protein
MQLRNGKHQGLDTPLLQLPHQPMPYCVLEDRPRIAFKQPGHHLIRQGDRPERQQPPPLLKEATAGRKAAPASSR